MVKSKKFWFIAAVGAVALTYAMVSSNAFADTSVPPVPTVTATVTPAVPTTPSTVSVSAFSGIQMPQGLQTSPLGTMPATGDDDADDQAGDQSDDATISGDDDGAISNNIASAQITLSDNGDDSHQDGGNQDDSGSND